MTSLRASSFLGPVVQDGWQLLLAESTATAALAFVPFRTKAAVDALLLAARSPSIGTPVITAANGIIEVAPGDGVELMILGTDAEDEAINLIIEGIAPAYDTNAPSTIKNYVTTPIGTVIATLGALTAGAAGTALTGIDTGDLLAKTIAITAGATSGFDPAIVIDPGAMGIMRVMACGCPYLYVRSDIDTAASAIVLARRIQNFLGGSQR